MKAEDQAKLNELRKQKKDSAKQIYLQSTKSEAELKQELSQHNELVQAVKELATALQVNVEPPDFEPVVKELKNLEQLPDAFIDIKNMSIAVSGKIQKLLDYFNNTHKPEFRIKGINKLLEVIEQHNGTRDKELISKFADLTTYLNQLSETLKQGQEPTDFKPVRIVVGGDGVPLKFLNNMPSSRGGGGSSSGGGGLTDAELRASPVDVNATIDTSAVATSANQTNKSQFTKLTDGTDTALITAAGEQNVIATAQPGVDIGDVTINNASIAVTQSGTWDEVGINDSGNSITVDNAGLTELEAAINASSQVDVNIAAGNITGFATSAKQDTAQTSLDTIAGDTTAIETAVQIMDDWDDGADSAKVVGNIASGSADSGNPVKVGGKHNTTTPTFTDGQRGDLQLGTRGSLKVEILSPSGTGATVITVPADGLTNSTNGLTTRSLGSVFNGTSWDRMRGDTTGTDVHIVPNTTGGWSVGNFTSGDTYTALTNSAQVIKASAGSFGGYYIYNPNALATYVMVYDIAAASVTVGTSTAKLVFCIPPTSGANLEITAGIPFATAMSVAAATTGGGNGAPTTALEAMVWYK